MRLFSLFDLNDNHPTIILLILGCPSVLMKGLCPKTLVTFSTSGVMNAVIKTKAII